MSNEKANRKISNILSSIQTTGLDEGLSVSLSMKSIFNVIIILFIIILVAYFPQIEYTSVFGAERVLTLIPKSFQDLLQFILQVIYFIMIMSFILGFHIFIIIKLVKIFKFMYSVVSKLLDSFDDI